MKRADAKRLIPLFAVALAACTSAPIAPESTTQPEPKPSTSASAPAATAAGATPEATPQATPQATPDRVSDAATAGQSTAGTPPGNGLDAAGSAPANAADAASRTSRTANSVEALERQLDAELSAFDAVVAETLEEPSAVEAPMTSAPPPTGGAGVPAPAANPNRGAGERAGTPYVGEKPPPPGLRRPSWAEDADRASSNAAPAAGQGTQPSASEDFYADDDVVARQLREAAERETDPELAEKLWQEYRNYKEVVQ